MFRKVDKMFFPMHFEPAPFAKGTTVGLCGRRGKLLIDVDGSEFIGSGSAGFVH
jgi:hypothetical protein